MSTHTPPMRRSLVVTILWDISLLKIATPKLREAYCNARLSRSKLLPTNTRRVVE